MSLALGQNVVTLITLLHLGSFITFRPSSCALCYLEITKSFSDNMELHVS